MRTSIRSIGLGAVLAAVLVGTVLATPTSNISPTILSRGTLSDRVHVNSGAVKFQTKGAVSFVQQTITFGAPATSGWHTHPGVVLVTLTSGQLVRYHDDCSSDVATAGDAWVESGSHAGVVRNESTTTEAVVHITYVVPAGTPNTGLRIDQPNPGCPVE